MTLLGWMMNNMASMNLQDITKKRLGPQLGSNPGGFYQGADDQKRYVKFYNDPLQANVEHLSNQIYGPNAPNTKLFPHNEGVAISSDFVPYKQDLTLNPQPKHARKVFESGFVPDVMLSNHDVIGRNGENIVIDDKDDVRRLDQGGTMMFRAMNGYKPEHVLNEIGEWDNFLNQGERKTKYGNLYDIAGYQSPQELIKSFVQQYNRIDDLREQVNGWGDFVDSNSVNLSPEQKHRITQILTHRQRLVKQKIDELIAHGGKLIESKAKPGKAVYNHFYEQIKSVANTIKHSSDYGLLYVNGHKVWWVMADSDDSSNGYDSPEQITKKFKKLPGVQDVTIESEYSPSKDEHWTKLDY